MWVAVKRWQLWNRRSVRLRLLLPASTHGPHPNAPPPPSNQNFQQIDTYIFLKIRLSTEMKTILLPGILVNLGGG